MIEKEAEYVCREDFGEMCPFSPTDDDCTGSIYISDGVYYHCDKIEKCRTRHND